MVAMIAAATPQQDRFVSERFRLPLEVRRELRRAAPEWGYGPFSEFVFYRTYARDGEGWADVITRVIEGTFSIRKQHYADHGIPWDEIGMTARAVEMAWSAFKGEWGPPGRGYWAMGTQMVYERGSMALNNCGFCDVKLLSHDVHWAMDALMLGVGVGFSAHHDVLSGLRAPRRGERVVTVSGDGTYPTRAHSLALESWDGADQIRFVVPDSREGWCDSVRLLLRSYETGGPTIRFDYSQVRPRGSKIRGFGGEASGPWPLRKLHRQIRTVMDNAVAHKDQWSNGRLITDVMNMVGCCIVAGNVRRSATIALGHPDDAEFAKLKDYGEWGRVGTNKQGKPIWGITKKTKWSYRRNFGWMSNNSYVLSEREHFERMIPLIASGIRLNGEPGFYNLKAVRSHGRLGDRVGTVLANGSVLQEDQALGINPCGEVPLESYELCCLAEWYPTRCLDNQGRIDLEIALRAAEHAAFYTQTVQLLPTHRPETNAVIARNRRTGVSLAGAATVLELTTMTGAIKLMEHGYDVIRRENKRLSGEAGVPEAIRVTALKPSGTTSLMMGVTSGAHWPTAGYMVRRVRVDDGRMSLRQVLEAANVPHEPDRNSANTEVYEFPIKTPAADRVRPVAEVSMWEQADFAATLAQHFVDNAVSVTVTFDPETEGRDVERLVASYAGKLKSMSMLPRSNHGYVQAPEEAIDETEYQRRIADLGELDWGSFRDDGQDEQFCSVCVVV